MIAITVAFVLGAVLTCILGIDEGEAAPAALPADDNGDDTSPNEAGLAFYHRILDELDKYGIEPIVTLYHFDMPQHLVEKYGGWASREAIDDYVRYAEICFRAFSSRVKYWLTINEQNLMARKDKLLGLEKVEESKREKLRHQMNHHMFLAGARTIKRFRELCPAGKIGPTFAYLPSYPATCKPEDMIAAIEADNLCNYYLTDIHVLGKYPAYYLNFLNEHGWAPTAASTTTIASNTSRTTSRRWARRCATVWSCSPTTHGRSSTS